MFLEILDVTSSGLYLCVHPNLYGIEVVHHLLHTFENFQTCASDCEGSRFATDGRSYEQVAAIQTLQALILSARLTTPHKML